MKTRRHCIVAATFVLVSAAACAEPTECGLCALDVSVQSAGRAKVVQSVTEGDNYFVARLTTITVGDTVTWTNLGQLNHTTTSDNGLWDSGQMKPGAKFSHTFKQTGTFDYSCTYHKTMGMVGKIIVLPLPPAISSPLSVTTAVGAAFHYEIAATNSPTTFLADPLPPGLTLSGNTLVGTPTTAGSFVVNLSVLNGGGSDGKALTIEILQPIFEADSDSDGFSDALELAVGSGFRDAAATPFAIPAHAAQTLNVIALQIGLNFASTGKDKLAFGATLPLPSGAPLAGQVLAFDLGGVVQLFTLDATGSAKTTGGTVKLASQTQNAVTFKVALKGAFATVLAGVGFGGTEAVKNAARPIPLCVLFNGAQYSTVRVLSYSVKSGKTGTAK